MRGGKDRIHDSWIPIAQPELSSCPIASSSLSLSHHPKIGERLEQEKRGDYFYFNLHAPMVDVEQFFFN